VIRQIVSADNHYIKLTASLKQKKYREEHGLFVAEGIRFVQEALAASWTLDYVLAAEEKLCDDRIQALLRKIEEGGSPILSMPLKL